MNGVHDMGGMHGFGPVQREENEPVFHESWEKTVYAMSTAMRAQGVFNIDESRHAIERIAPARYLASSYYERWLASLETNLVEKGVLRPDEIEARTRLLRDTLITGQRRVLTGHAMPAKAAAGEVRVPPRQYERGDEREEDERAADRRQADLVPGRQPGDDE